ncbi:MAG TPA: PQQ-binding-like beta-propeller repeat protein [Bacteroidales bacterium]|nr:PQQ-binding-like beta-propeller repeat protein [Bacteroidales bacterium]
MKKILLSSVLVLFFFSSASAQEKIFETKISAFPITGSGANKETAVYAGTKNFNVVQLTTGKMILDKTYKDAGVSVSKVTDAYVNDDLSKLVLCDGTTVSCVDTKTGTKTWETKSFTELDNSSSALMIFGNYVLVTDKKGKENFSLTCHNIADGKELWSLTGEKNRIGTGDLYFIPSFTSLGVFTGKTGQFRIVELATGKTASTFTIEGSPIYSLLDEESGTIYVHHRVAEDNSYVSAISMKSNKLIWKTKSANKSPQTPMTMNTDIITYYAKVRSYDDKVLLITEGLEAFDTATGKLVFNVPFVPYYEWGVGHYTNGIFEPVITEDGILIADRTSKDMYIRMVDKNSGRQIWSTDKLKDMDSAPVAVVSGENAVIQFGGLNYFEVMNNTGIGKLLKPFTIMSFDLKTGKNAWTLESKKDFYYISNSNEKVMIVGTKEFQSLDPKTGAVLATEKNPFSESYFMTKFDLSSTHKLQKNVEFDFSARKFLLFEEGKLSLSTF